MSEKVINIMNFVRGIEPRFPTDLSVTILNELEMCKKYGFKNTVLLQYDAMINSTLMNMILEKAPDNTEFGLWFEMCRQLVESLGIEWKGREGYDWDWHVNSGFLVGYTNEQRLSIIDEVMRKFKEIFGYYPKSVGSWIIDSFSMQYMSEKYNIKAFGICREQYSVDAYNLWGGYSNQAYYPSKNNMLCPAQSEENKINTPVFRLLGIDPVYGYDEEHHNPRLPGCYTMEAFWPSSHDESVVDWYYDTYFNQECINFAYAQIGQENSFGWKKIKIGLDIQFEKLALLEKMGVVKVKTMGETGELFAEKFSATPPTSLYAAYDWSDNGIKSLWYNCINYRANLFLKGNKLYFRDLYKFDECYTERYLDKQCVEWEAVYDNLPIIDGRLWNTENYVSGLYFKGKLSKFDVEKYENGLKVYATFDNDKQVEIIFDEQKICVKGDIALHFKGDNQKDNIAYTKIDVMQNKIVFEHNGFAYAIGVYGNLKRTTDGYNIIPVERMICINCAERGIE